MKSLEGLERGNFTTKYYDNFHTYKGDRQKANKGVFKLLRLKSNRLLRKFQSRHKRVQRCSKCKTLGHNSTNKGCPAKIDLSDMIEDGDGEEMATSDTELEFDILENTADEDLANIDELLDSDDDYF